MTIGEAYQDDITIDAWRDAKGRSADLAPLACERSQLVSLQPVDDWVPIRQDYEGYTGNAGNTLDRWYHKSVIAIWPESTHFEIVTKMGLHFAVAELLQRRTALTEYRTDEELEQACDQCQQLAESIIRHWPDRKYERDGSNADAQTWLMQFTTELPKFDDPDLIDDFLQVVASQDWRTNLDQFVITSLRRIGVDEILPLLHRLLGFDPPPNQHGHRVLEGLATRDARWLLKLAKDKVHGGLSTEQLHGLISKATEKLARHARQLTGNEYRRSMPPTDCWLILSQATIAAQSNRLADMLKLVQDCPALFDLRKFQVPSAVKLRDFSSKRVGEVPEPLAEWLNQLKRQLEIKTSAEPQPPSDFRRPSDTECECRYCRQLSEFLAGPSMKQTRIAAAERARDHLEQVIYSRKLDASIKTVRTGSPYSLELTKTTESYKADLKQYHSDLNLFRGLT